MADDAGVVADVTAVSVAVTPESEAAAAEVTGTAGTQVEQQQQHYHQQKVAAMPEAKDSKDNKAKKPAPAPMVAYGWLLQHQDGWDKLLWAIGLFSAVANGLQMPAFTLLFGHLLDSFHPGESNEEFMDSVRYFALIIALCGLGSFVLAYTEIAPLAVSAERQMRRFREFYVQSILGQDIKWFDENNIDQVVTRVTDDCATIQAGIGDKVGLGVRQIFTFLFGFAMGFAYSWQLTLVLLGMAPIMAFCGALMMKMMSTFESEGQAAYAEAGGVAEERLGGIRTVQAFAGQKAALETYNSHLEKASKAGLKKGLAQGGSVGFTSLIMFLTYALAFWVGSLLIAHDRDNAVEELTAAGCKGGRDFTSICMNPASWEPLTNTACWALCTKIYDCLGGTGCHTGGRVVEVFFAVIIGSMAIGQATPSIAAMTSARVAGKRVADIVATARKDTSGGGKREPTAHVSQGIVFRNVAFAYPTRPDQPVLRDFTLDIAAGMTVALVGRSGSGKSTVVSLLEKFYAPTAGTIAIDGVDLADIHTEKLRSVIGLVGQEPVLFSGTIRENIALGATVPVTDEEIKAAADAANAASFIATFPDGYDTLVGQGGKALSGGQKQRIAIARALIRKPAIMLLDEATSALDSTSEAVVQVALDKIMADASRVTIVIAHRLSTIKNCSKIVVVSEGVVVEQGTHDELMQIQGGVYRDLVEAQASGRDGQLQEEAAVPTGDAEVGADGATPDAENAEVVAAYVDVVEPGTGRTRSVSVTRTRTRGPSAAPMPAKKAAEPSVPMARILRLGSEHAVISVFAILASMVQGVVMPMFAVVFSEIVTMFFELNTDTMLTRAGFWAGMFVIIAVVCGTCYVVAFGGFAVVGQSVTRKLRLQSLSAMLHQDMAFHDQEVNKTGNLTTRLATDATLVNAMATDRFALLAQNLVTAIAAFAISFSADWRLTLVVLSVGPLVFAGSAIQMKVFAGASQAAQASLATAGHIVSESIHGVRTVHAFNLQPTVVGMYGARLLTPMKAGVRGGHVAGGGFGFAQFIMFAGWGLAFYVGGLWIADGSLTFEAMLRVIMTVMMSAVAIGQSSAMATDMAKAKQAAIAIFALLDAKPKVDSASTSGLKPSEAQGAIEFKDVTFTYPTRRGRVLKRFSMTVPAGTTVALVGSSGSGKSTIVQLLQRFYVPDSGSVWLDGRDLAELNTQWLRKHMGIVSQEPILFKGTVADNIAYGKHPDDGAATHQEIEAAARMANAHDFIMADLPNGYDTDISSTTLSGGQKQRIAIARAILRDPSILLLDEATSALDNRSEEVVQRALDALLQAKRRTTIVIAHRLSTIKNADQIIVMDHGEIIQQGTHDYLKSVPGKYQDMWQQQLLVSAGERIA